MKMPDAEAAVVPPAKVTEYLLNAAHPGNRGKAAVFAAFGFSSASWLELSTALKRHAIEGEVTKRVETVYGTKYVVVGGLPSPDGRTPILCTIWFAEDGAAPRLVTAYPA
jgi:hypothetical protein